MIYPNFICPTLNEKFFCGKNVVTLAFLSSIALFYRFIHRFCFDLFVIYLSINWFVLLYFFVNIIIIPVVDKLLLTFWSTLGDMSGTNQFMLPGEALNSSDEEESQFDRSGSDSLEFKGLVIDGEAPESDFEDGKFSIPSIVLWNIKHN